MGFPPRCLYWGSSTGRRLLPSPPGKTLLTPQGQLQQQLLMVSDNALHLQQGQKVRRPRAGSAGAHSTKGRISASSILHKVLTLPPWFRQVRPGQYPQQALPGCARPCGQVEIYSLLDSTRLHLTDSLRRRWEPSTRLLRARKSPQQLSEPGHTAQLPPRSRPQELQPSLTVAGLWAAGKPFIGILWGVPQTQARCGGMWKSL